MFITPSATNLSQNHNYNFVKSLNLYSLFIWAWIWVPLGLKMTFYGVVHTYLEFFNSLFSYPSDLQLLHSRQLPQRQLRLPQVQRRGPPPEEPLQPADLQRGGFPVVRQLCHRAGTVHAGGGLFLLLLGLQQTGRHPHFPRDRRLHARPQVGQRDAVVFRNNEGTDSNTQSWPLGGANDLHNLWESGKELVNGPQKWIPAGFFFL